MKFFIRQITASDNTQLQYVGDFLCFLKQDYPNFRKWYRQTVIPGLATGKRQIYAAAPEKDTQALAGLVILKDTPEQKKICTLYVDEPYRGMGLGDMLLDHAISQLGVSHPLITVSDRHQKAFTALFRRFGFRLFNRYAGYYNHNIIEYSYNGPIETASEKRRFIQDAKDGCEIAL